MLYSIGYQNLTPAGLVRVLDTIGCTTVLDVRASPRSRKAGFGANQIKALLGDRYRWVGDVLGGPGGGGVVRPEGLDLAAAYGRSKEIVCMMCLEEEAIQCHRHHDIAIPLYRQRRVKVRHIIENDVIDAHELQRSIDDGDDYTYHDLFPTDELEPGALDIRS